MTSTDLLSRLARHRLSPRAYAVLREIECSPETLKHISTVVDSSFQNLSAVVDTLERRGLAGRVKEGRSTTLGITEKGKLLLEEIGE